MISRSPSVDHHGHQTVPHRFVTVYTCIHMCWQTNTEKCHFPNISQILTQVNQVRVHLILIYLNNQLNAWSVSLLIPISWWFWELASLGINLGCLLDRSSMSPNSASPSTGLYHYLHKHMCWKVPSFITLSRCATRLLHGSKYAVFHYGPSHKACDSLFQTHILLHWVAQSICWLTLQHPHSLPKYTHNSLHKDRRV